MNDPTLPLPGLSPVDGKRVEVRFDGGLLSSDGGVLALREVEKRLGVADRLAACLVDPRNGAQVTHSFADIIRFRLLMIAAGYEDGIDANALRSDPMFKMALDTTPSQRDCARNRRSRGWRTCPTLARCCAWGGRWSISTAPRSQSRPSASRSTSTTRSTPSTAASNCAVQRALRRIRLPADRRVRRPGSVRHRRSSSRQASERQRDQALPAPACCAPSAPTGRA